MTKVALISPIELVNKKITLNNVETSVQGYRVAQVEEPGNEFSIAEPLFWITTTEPVVADLWLYHPETKKLYEIIDEMVPIVKEELDFIEPIVTE